MSYPIFARSALAVAIASLSMAAFAQESEAAKSPEEISSPADQIVVTATRTPMRYNQLISDVSVVEQEEIRDYGAQAPISDILANEAGVTVRTSGGLGTTTSIQMRGANTNQTILLVDGLRLNSASTGAAPWAFLPMPQFNRMEIVRGPTSSSYGSDAIGGVIQLFTRKGEGPTKFYADAEYGTYNTTSETLGVEGSEGSLSYSIYGANTHSVGIPTYTKSLPNAMPGSYTNTSASANLIYTLAAGQEIGIKGLYGTGKNGQWNNGSYYDSSWMLVEDYGMATQGESMNLISVHSKNRIGDDWISLVRIGSSQDNSNTIYSGSQGWMSGRSQSFFNTTQKQAQWQNDFNLPVGKGMLAYEYLNQFALTSENAAGYSRNTSTFQGGWNAEIGSNLIQANLRNDANSQYGNATTGSVGYGYFMLPSLRLTGSWGTGYQAPTFNDLYYPTQGDGYSWSVNGNPNLQPTRSQNTEGGIRFDNGRQKLGVIYYYNNVTNLVQWRNSMNGNISIYAPENYGRSVLQGVTTTYGTKVLGLNVSGSVDYQDSQDMQTGLVLPYHPFAFGSATVEKDAGRWKFGAQTQFQGNQQSNPGSTNNQNLGGYTLFNLYGNLTLKANISAYFRINNLLNKQYATNYDSVNQAFYRTPGSQVFVGLRFDTR
ncbi:MAG: TonB-dependent receptor domain-containing protein [Fluviibacter sp.]